MSILNLFHTHNRICLGSLFTITTWTAKIGLIISEDKKPSPNMINRDEYQATFVSFFSIWLLQPALLLGFPWNQYFFLIYVQV